jgi:hypothetical protein
VLDRDRDYLAHLHTGYWGTPLGPGTPLAPMRRIEAVRGYNPLDLLRYKEYLQFVGGTDKPLQGLGGGLMSPVMANFPVRQTKFLDLLNVRYVLRPEPNDEPVATSDISTTTALGMIGAPLQPGPLLAVTALIGNEAVSEQAFLKRAGWHKVAEDPHPATYNFLWGGVLVTPTYAIFENRHAFPRAYVVPEAAALPERSQVLPMMLATDFHRRVLLENWQARTDSQSVSPSGFRSVAIKEYHPNRIVLDPTAGPGGYLVLADIWYPGWHCTVDGQPAEIHRANFLFRGIELPAGATEVVFTFEPQAYLWGQRITWGTLVVVLVIAGATELRRVTRKKVD